MFFLNEPFNLYVENRLEGKNCRPKGLAIWLFQKFMPE